MTFEVIIGILLAGILSNNYALLHFLGTGAVIENERSSRRSVIVGAGTTIVMVLSTLITWPINKYVLGNATYLQTLVFVIVVMLVAELVHLLAKKHIEGYCKVYTPTFAINGALLGLCIHNTELAFGEALVTGEVTSVSGCKVIKPDKKQEIKDYLDNTPGTDGTYAKVTLLKLQRV